MIVAASRALEYKAIPMFPNRTINRTEVLTRSTFVAASLLALTIAGCANISGIETTAVLRTPTSAGTSAVQTDFPSDRWWLKFNDPALTSLIDAALQGNPTLAIAKTRAEKMALGVDLAKANALPLVVGGVDLTRQRYTANGMIPPPLAGADATTATIQATASWDIDFFGRNERAVRAALGTARASELDLQAARVLLANSVARQYVQLARLLEQMRLANATLRQREQVVSLIRQRVDAGLDTNVELQQGEGAIPETRGQIEALNEQIALTRNALVALTARPADVINAMQPPLTSLQLQSLPAAVPSELVARRADLAAARWRVEAALNEIDVAKTQFYPSINLIGFAGLSSIGLDKLFQGHSLQYGIGPTVRLPIFEAGKLRINLKSKTGDFDAAVDTYNATLIEAIHEVGDQLVSIHSIDRQMTEQRSALAAADNAYELSLQRYRAGLGTYLNVLAAETAVIAQRRAGADLRARAIDAQVLLVRALGGGFSATDEPLVSTAPTSQNK